MNSTDRLLDKAFDLTLLFLAFLCLGIALVTETIEGIIGFVYILWLIHEKRIDKIANRQKRRIRNEQNETKTRVRTISRN